MLDKINLIAKKIAKTLNYFFTKEKQIEKNSRDAFLTAIKDSDKKQIQEIKNKINQL